MQDVHVPINHQPLPWCFPPDVGLLSNTPADLHQGANQPTGVTSASLMGTYTAPAGATQRLFSNTSKLPFHGASAGALGAPGAGMTQTMLLLAPQLSQAEAHNFDVPPHVKTGMDAVKLFASSAAKEGLIVFCNLNPQAKVRARLKHAGCVFVDQHAFLRFQACLASNKCLQYATSSCHAGP